MARQRVLGAQAAAHALRHLAQQRVAQVVPQGVVDVFEVVDVNEHQRRTLWTALQGAQQLLHPVIQQAAVGQASERVVKRQLKNLLLGLLVPGDVGRDATQGRDAPRRIAQRQFDRHKTARHAAVGTAVDFFLLHAFAVLDHPQVVHAQFGGGGLVKKRRIGLVDDLRQWLAKQLADFAVGILVAQLRVFDVDERIDTVQNGVKPCLAGLQVGGLLRHLAAQPQAQPHGQRQQPQQGAHHPPHLRWNGGGGGGLQPALHGQAGGRVALQLPFIQGAVNGTEQVGMAAFGRGVKQLRRLKHNGRGHQSVGGGVQVAKKPVGGHRIQVAVGGALKAALKRVHRHQHRSHPKAGQHGLKRAGLHRAGHHPNALGVEVGDGLNGHPFAFVDLRPAQQRRCAVKVKHLRTLLGQSHVGHQVNLAVLQRLQTGLPLAAHGLQLPALALGDGQQHVTQNAAGLPVAAKKDFGRVLVHPHAHHLRLVRGVRGAKQRPNQPRSRQPPDPAKPGSGNRPKRVKA